MKPAASRVLQALAVVVYATMVLLAPATARAQEARGTITGKVKDANEAVLPGASVKIINTARGTTVTLSTNDAGFFQAPYLLPGTYRVEVEVNGFKKYIRDGLLLQIGNTLDIAIQLEIGQTSESLTVTAENTTLDTTSGSMSLQFRAEFTNFFNHPWLSAASGNSGSSGVITVPTNADFGKIANISNQANYARRVQIGLKLLF